MGSKRIPAGTERLLSPITAQFCSSPRSKLPHCLMKCSRAGHNYNRGNTASKGTVSNIQFAKGLVGDSPKFLQVVRLMHKVADTSANVLITGESGTGKEVFARALHESSRRDKPFIAINCGALPESLLEAELFGIERGVATGVDARAGTFEQANGGTLFLDEIGDMALNMQVRLLRVLQERQVVRVGGTKVTNVDVRVIAATHRQLVERIAEGTFRQDLYYRLKVVTLELPSLRERPKDILTLDVSLSDVFPTGTKNQYPVFQLLLRALLTYPWPGNIRELEHAIEQAIILMEGDTLHPQNFGLGEQIHSGLVLEFPDDIDSFASIRQEVEDRLDRELVTRALAAANGNRTAPLNS